MFADMRASWASLPEARKQLLSGLTGLHGWEYLYPSSYGVWPMRRT